MARKVDIVWFEEVSKEDVGLVGGKGANLGELIRAHFPVPYGFIITSHAYFSFIKEANIDQNIHHILKNINYDNPSELQQASKNIQKLILDVDISRELASSIVKHYDMLVLKEEEYLTKNLSQVKRSALHLKSVYKSPLVAVRSSATAEDLPNASFAGQQETFLNVNGDSHLLLKVKECWASLFTERAIYYRHQQGFDHKKIGLAAVVQRMVQSDKSGVAFSIDPVTNDKSKIVIEAIFGLGEFIVQGRVTPDHYEVDKNSFVILKKEVKQQKEKYVKNGIMNKVLRIKSKEGLLQKLTDEEILQVALLVKDIEKHYFFPQDLEWAIEKKKVFIVQSRPITTIKDNKLGIKDKEDMIHNSKFLILSGAPASPGIATGPVVVIYSPHEISKVNKGDILVAPQTNPDYVPAMKKAAAIVTEKGGRTSHAAIVSRELGIPAVVGAEGATKKLHKDKIVTVDGAAGEIYSGKLAHHHITESVHDGKRNLKTLTKVYVNLAEPEQAERIAKLDVDGVGLLRAEFMVAQIGVHPKEFIRKKRQELFVRTLARNLLKFAKPFSPRPVIYRSTDFKTNEYRHLVGGSKYEPKEENPMLGYRGASRYIAEPEVFQMELDAIRLVWKHGYQNLHLMIPFVRRPWELIKIKQLIEQRGLFQLPNFKLYMMIEVPSSVFEIEEFLKIGVDGVSIGTNDLTMMLLGVDRDNAEVAPLYDERSPTVMKALEYVVQTCVRYGVTCSICGQAASDYPELVEQLVSQGLTSVSVNPDAIERTRELIHEIEKKHFKKKVTEKLNYTPLNS